MAEQNSSVTWHTPNEICKGEDPDIAMAGNKVLLVFSKRGDLLYKTGLLDSSSRSITWGPETKMDDYARYPSVSMTDDAFIVLYQDHSNNKLKLKTVCGKNLPEGREPTWKLVCGIAQDHSSSTHEHYTGENPSIALFKDHTFIAIHQTGVAAGRTLQGRIGRVNLKGW